MTSKFKLRGLLIDDELYQKLCFQADNKAISYSQMARTIMKEHFDKIK